MTRREGERYPLRREGLQARAEGRHVIISTSEGQAAFELDALGTAIWELCDGATSVDEIATAVRRVFDVPQTVVARDVAQLIGQFEAAGLVTQVEEGTVQ
jgi:hypothetical protein